MARFSKADNEWCMTIVKEGKFSPTENVLLLSAFDEQTNYDIKMIEDRMKKEAQARRQCLYKIVLYPFDLVLTRFLLGKKAAEDKRGLQKVYNLYYKKKINYTELQKRLANILKDVTIVTKTS